MRKKLNKMEVKRIVELQRSIDAMADAMKSKGKDVALQFGDNGSVCDQLGVASAALETILQECF